MFQHEANTLMGKGGWGTTVVIYGNRSLKHYKYKVVKYISNLC